MFHLQPQNLPVEREEGGTALWDSFFISPTKSNFILLNI